MTSGLGCGCAARGSPPSVQTPPVTPLIKLPIKDDDPTPRGEIRRLGPERIPEDGGHVEFVVSLDRPTERLPGLVLEVEPTVDTVAQPVEDFDLRSVVFLRFGAAETAKTIEIRTVDDAVDEPDEVLEMVVLNSSSTPTLLPRGGRRASVEIVDDDTRGITVAPTALSLADGGETSYSVVLESEPDSTATASENVNVFANAVAGLTITPRRLRFGRDDWQGAAVVPSRIVGFSCRRNHGEHYPPRPG